MNSLLKEPLINSESFSCAGKMRQIKTPIAGNSKAIAKIGNAELVHFNKQMLIHELIRGSLNNLIRKTTKERRCNGINNYLYWCIPKARFR